MAFVNVKDVGDRLGRPITDLEEVAQVNAWINDAETLIRARVRDFDVRVSEGCLDPDIVRLVVGNAVERKLRNPDGKQNERIDDYSYGLNADAARGAVFITDEEWALLQPSGGDGAFSIVPGGYPSGKYWWPTTDRWEPLR